MYQTDITTGVIVSVPLIGGILSLLFTFYLYSIVSAAETGDPKLIQNVIAGIIQSGARAFLVEEYTWLAPFVAFMAIFFFVEEGITCANGSAVYAQQCGTLSGTGANAVVSGDDFPGKAGWRMAICFIIGAALSASAGYAGMTVATECNVKAAHAAKMGAESAEKDGLNRALKVAFAGGAVMGFTVVGLGLTGLTALFALFAGDAWDANADLAGFGKAGLAYKQSLQYMAAFSFGASAIALFARVAGGIYTKAADVGADLVGKVEEDFPEDSFYNPATIADNVGDNVGDVAGMGADLFESYVGSIVACATIGLASFPGDATTAVPDFRRVAFPFWIAGFGVIASLLGFFFVSTETKLENEDGTTKQAGDILAALLFSLHKGVYSSSVFITGFSALAVALLYADGNNGVTSSDAAVVTAQFPYESADGWKDFGCMLIGLVTGVVIGELTEYFTAYEFTPTQTITRSGVTGPATVIIQGLGIGMLSAVPPVLVIVAAILACTALSGVYGAAVAAVGMLSTLGITLATDAYGPVADNAGGIAEMSHLPGVVRETTDALDALGNTTAATGKGFAVGSAVLAALAFVNAFASEVQTQITAGTDGSSWSGLNFFSITDPKVLSGLLIGSMLPYLFAALTMLSVGKAATAIILQVRRQLLDESPVTRLTNGEQVLKDGQARKRGETLKELVNMSVDYGNANKIDEFVKWLDDNNLGPDDFKPDTDVVISECTKSSLLEMIIPGIFAVLTPIGVGLLVGARCLGGLLVGAIASGFLLAVMMNNAGGAWDNSKKWVENDGPELKDAAGTTIKVEKNSKHPDEKVRKKAKDWHSAVVVGDTVGDPFKDTSGPALNILIKLMSVLSLTCAKMFRDDWETYWIGVIVLVLEMGLAAIAFYYVWWQDEEEAPAAPAAAPGAAAPAAPAADADGVELKEAEAPAAEPPAAEAPAAEAAPASAE